MDIYLQYNELDDKIAQLSQEIKILKEQRDEVEQLIIEDLDNQEATSIVKYGFNWIKRIEKHWPKITDSIKLVNWMLNNDNKHLVSVNSKTLGTFIKETQIVPDGVDVAEKIDLQRRKYTGKQ